MIVPGVGMNLPPAGSSALMRTSMAWPSRRTSSWVKVERLARRDAQLPLDEVEAGDQLGDRVLDLESGVHLQEEELAVLVEELDGARVHVAAGLGDLDRRFAHGATHVVGEVRRRGLLDEFLVTALGRAVALAEPERGAVGVGEDLHLDVTGPGQVALDVALGSSEVTLGFALRALQAPPPPRRRRSRPSCRVRRRRRRP